METHFNNSQMETYYNNAQLESENYHDQICVAKKNDHYSKVETYNTNIAYLETRSRLQWRRLLRRAFGGMVQTNTKPYDPDREPRNVFRRLADSYRGESNEKMTQEINLR